jgi:hypothetical protein
MFGSSGYLPGRQLTPGNTTWQENTCIKFERTLTVHIARRLPWVLPQNVFLFLHRQRHRMCTVPVSVRWLTVMVHSVAVMDPHTKNCNDHSLVTDPPFPACRDDFHSSNLCCQCRNVDRPFVILSTFVLLLQEAHPINGAVFFYQSLH